jgi:hypothetical protein
LVVVVVERCALSLDSAGVMQPFSRNKQEEEIKKPKAKKGRRSAQLFSVGQSHTSPQKSKKKTKKKRGNRPHAAR